MSSSPGTPTSAEVRLMTEIQSRLGGPVTVPAARALSLVGEHAAGWLLLAGAGAVLDAPRRPRWVRAGCAVLAAHGASVVLKRVWRRRRPEFDGLAVHVGVLSNHSFPSSHSTSTTAAAVALAPLAGSWLWPTALAMGVSRVLVGVHWPSDVLAGAALGAVVSRAVVGRPR